MQLFPDPAHLGPPPLVGIARMASAAGPLDSKSQVEYLNLEAKSLLNRCDSPRVPFDWTINPYRGCEFGCHYCYARYTHEYMELDGQAFEQKIFVKGGAERLLLEELKHFKGKHIAIGTATDPYQPAERRFRLTRRLLAVFAEHRGLRLSITTKSNLVARDVDLLTAIARHNVLHVNLTVTTVRAGLARILEPKAPRPQLRLEAVGKLVAAGIDAGVFAAPILPGITDPPGDLEMLFRAARKVGARYLMVNPLFLPSCARKQFLPFLEKEFPKLTARYRRRFQHGIFLPPDYKQWLGEVVKRLRSQYGLPSSPTEYPVEEMKAQLRLF